MAGRLEIGNIIRQYFDQRPEETFVPGVTSIPLAVPQYGAEEVLEALDSFLSGWVTMGKKVKEFERMFSSYVGTKGGVLTNSGSSGVLLTLSALSSQRLGAKLKSGDEIICPATTWPTTVYPMRFFGVKPVFVDVEPGTYNLNPDLVENAITSKTRGVLAAHLMGNPCRIDRIREIADARGMFVLEDTCESHGAKIGDKMAGSFGTCSIFSFFLSHHITTLEGGMVLSDDEALLDNIATQRAYGWTRDMRNSHQISIQYPNIDSRFLFYEMGFNLRPTEVQGAFGIQQLPKLEKFIEIRRRVAKRLNEKLSPYKEYLTLPEEREGTRNSYFAYLLTVREGAPFTRKEITDFLESRRIATRPLVGGSLLEQPSAQLYEFRKVGSLENAKRAMHNAFFMGVHHGIGEEQHRYIVRCFEEFISAKTRR